MLTNQIVLVVYAIMITNDEMRYYLCICNNDYNDEMWYGGGGGELS